MQSQPLRLQAALPLTRASRPPASCLATPSRDPFYSRNRRLRMQEQKGGMNFLEAIFSFVFGDGDPNTEFDKQRWQAVSGGRCGAQPASTASLRCCSEGACAAPPHPCCCCAPPA